MARDDDRVTRGILGDINPTQPVDRRRERAGNAGESEIVEDDESMAGGSRHDRTEHSGSRDVTEGTTGGTGTETGGTRNYRTGTGVTGGDIGNRPE